MHKVTKLFLSLLLLAAIGVVIYPRIKGGSAGKAAPPPPEKAPLPVSIIQVLPTTLQDKIEVNGNVLADEQAELHVELSGKIVSISFAEGSRVEKGSQLLKINDTELQAEKQRITYEITLAKGTLKRQDNLLRLKSTSQENYDQALNRKNTLQAQLDVLEARLEKTVIRAPFDGIMSFRYVSVGSFVTSNTRIAFIQKIDPVKIDFAIPEKYAGRVAPGNLIQFSLPGSNRSFQGEVYAVESRIDPVTRTLPIRAVAPNPNHLILPGAFASVELIFAEIGNALMVPSEALIPILGGQKVFIAVDGRAQERAVTIGIRSARMVRVTTGLQAGDAVIRTGILQLREGMALNILAEKTLADEAVQ